MAEVLLVNPRRRKKKGGKRSTSAKKTTAKRTAPAAAPKKTKRKTASPKRRFFRKKLRLRRNPARRGFNIMDYLKNTLGPAAIGGVSALGVDLAVGFLPLPPNMKTGPLRPIVKGGAAVAIGLVASQLTSRKMAEQITAGALTVVMYDTIKTFVQGKFPALPLSEYYDLGYVSPSPTLEMRASPYIESSGMMGLDAYVPQELLHGAEVYDDLGAYVEQASMLY